MLRDGLASMTLPPGSTRRIRLAGMAALQPRVSWLAGSLCSLAFTTRKAPFTEAGCTNGLTGEK